QAPSSRAHILRGRAGDAPRQHARLPRASSQGSFHDGTLDASRDCRRQFAMSTPIAPAAERPFVLLVGLDLDDSESSGYAFEQAARIGSRIPGCAVHVVHVAPAGASVEEMDRLAGLLRLYVSDSAAALHVSGPDAT